MLLTRSICLQVCLLITLTRSFAQEYESGYDVEDSEDHSDAQDDSGLVDYSKYYSVDTSAPLVAAQGNPGDIGFSGPIEYAKFFEPSLDFAASTKQEVAQPKNPFAAPTKNVGFIANLEQFPEFHSGGGGVFDVDYFEEAQKAQRQEESKDEEPFIPPGPSYISHNLPVTLEGGYSTGVGKIQAKPSKQQKTKKIQEYDVEKEAAAEYEYQPSAPSGKFTDYNTGKSSSTVAQSQYPEAAAYYEKHTQAPKATPYQKYSFQPVTEQSETKYLAPLISTIAPFNPAYTKVASTDTPAFESQPSENVPAHLKDKNCRRVRKHIPEGENHDRRKRDAMNCFVCEDAESNSKYTQCAYAEEDPEPLNDYTGNSERYSIPSKNPEGFRYKRYSGDENVDPYEFIKTRSQKYEDEQNKEFEEYKIPDFYTEYDGLEKSFSEIQTEALAQNPANCHKEESKGMTCTVCKDPKTGGNYEQCSYTSEPKEQKYAFVTEKKYDNNEPEQGSESKPVVQTKEIKSNINDDKEKKSEPLKEAKSEPSSNEPITLPTIDKSKYFNLEDFSTDSKEVTAASSINDDDSKYANFKPAELYKANYRGHDKFKLSDQYNPDSKEDPTSKKEQYIPESHGFQGTRGAPQKLINDEPYDIPKHFAESTIKEQKTGVRGLEPSLYGSADSAEVSDDADSASNTKSDSYNDEYHFKLFPDFSNQETQQAEVVTNNKNPSADATRKDVEEVLAEFTRKDRSACKKAEKNGMTCYLCVDKKGIQHEECMYVSESKPQASHVAYHEVQQLKAPDANKQSEQHPSGTEVKNVVQKPEAASSDASGEMQAAASEGVETRIKYNPNKNKKRKVVKKVKQQQQESEGAATQEDPQKLYAFDDEPKTKAPSEFVVGAEEGAFSAETKPVYSKTLGVKLPKYMIDKSEFEKEFDEFAGIHY